MVQLVQKKNGCAWAKGSPRSFQATCLAACRVAKALDDLAAGNRMKGERVHEMVVGDILAQGSVISAEHLLGGGGADNALSHGAASVKQQRRAWRDADIAYRKEHRAGGLTVTVDAKAFARRIILLDHVQEPPKRCLIARTVAMPKDDTEPSA